MINQLLDFINRQKLFHPDEQILLAVSGGIDSVVMQHLFKRAGLKYSVAHCNFQLRGEESNGDEEFVRSLAKRDNVHIDVKTFNTEEYANSQGISIQMAARELRREWFEELLRSGKYLKIATAHHLNDSLETAIFNLTKGTGIAGLKGITPFKGNYIRPLLFATREMIQKYASENRLEWREDRTNSSIKYSRNLIRHQVIPELKKINPNLEFTFAQTMERIAGATEIFNNFIAKQKSSMIQEKNGLMEIDKMEIKNTAEPQLVLFELLHEYGYNYAQAKEIYDVLDHQPGIVFYSDNYEIIVDREKLYLQRKESGKSGMEWPVLENTQSLTIDSKKLEFSIIDASNYTIEKDKNIALLDLEKLRFPLKLRYWRQGDVFYPLGMKHKKKVSDFMIDEKIPVNLKKQTLTLFSGKDLVWIVGHRIDNRFKITEKTRKVFRIYNDKL